MTHMFWQNGGSACFEATCFNFLQVYVTNKNLSSMFFGKFYHVLSYITYTLNEYLHPYKIFSSVGVVY